jgi:predicted alpha/beta-hydrolase family hydrolase
LRSPSELTVAVAPDQTTTALVYHADRSPAPSGPGGATLILAHGAGAGQRSPFMTDFALALSALGLDVVTFNFLYTEQRRRAPDRPPLLEACYRAVIGSVRGGKGTDEHLFNLFIGGKSMGGRIATQVVAADRTAPVSGLVLLGYPLHPPGKPDQRRDAHLPRVDRPMLFVQGSRDAFGTPEELAPVVKAIDHAKLEVVDGGDHSFKQPRRDPAAQAAVYQRVQRTIVEWIASVIGMSAAARHRSG